ncbi:MAG: hypothetical protein H0W10_06300 [Chloroflexi bacterium]|nr:hypothetical protein [Chloroflexota bacterium]
MDAIGIPGHFASADAPDPEDIGWIYTQWAIGRQQAKMGARAGGLLVLDEIQKIRDWSDVVKQLWDEDTLGEPSGRRRASRGRLSTNHPSSKACARSALPSGRVARVTKASQGG